MRTSAKVGFILAMAMAAAGSGCPAGGTTQNGLGEEPEHDGGPGGERPVDGRDEDGEDGDDGDRSDGGAHRDAGAEHDAGAAEPDGGESEEGRADAGMAPAPNRPPEDPPDEPAPAPPPQTAVPDELVGVWQSSPIDFELWENYREGYYAGRSAVPSREAMIFEPDGRARFYRYEFAFTAYEELIDCEGTVAFHGDGTFTFYPVSGRKRFYNARHSEDNTDRALTAEELLDPELAGTRGYEYLADSMPEAIRITVPSSAPYNWYKRE